MILPFDQAKAVARGATQILYLPALKAKRPKTGQREPIQSRQDDGRVTHCHVLVGMWWPATLRPLLAPSALKDRHAAGWRLGDGIVQMCDDWMRKHDSRWPRYNSEPCDTCDQTGVIVHEPGGFPPRPDEPCGDCNGDGWTYTEQDVTEQQVLDRFDKRWADRPVYAIIVTVDRVEAIRIPTPSGRPRGDELGYSHNPADDVLDIGEAVPVGYQELLSRKARERDDELRKARGEGRDMRSKRFVDRKRAA